MARLKHTFVEAYVERSVVPHIRARATEFAHQILGYIELLMPRQETCLYEWDTRGIRPAPEANPQPRPDADPGSADVDEAPQKLYEGSARRIEFRERPIDVFEKALTWDVDKSKHPYESYRYDFPALRTRFETDQVQWENGMKTDNRFGTTLIALMPIVNRRVRQTVLGDFGPYEVVGPGTVVAQTNKEEEGAE